MRRREDFKVYLFPFDADDKVTYGYCVRWLRGKPTWTIAGIDGFCDQMAVSYDQRETIKRNLIHAYGTIMLARSAGHLTIEYTDAGTPYIAMRTRLGDIVNED